MQVPGVGVVASHAVRLLWAAVGLMRWTGIAGRI